MGERICSVRDCGLAARSMGMCNRHYLGARRSGELATVEPKAALHRITDPDVHRGVATCAVCGPETPIRVRLGRGHECQKRRRLDRRRDRVRKYGLTPADVERMRFEQLGRCAICQKPEEKLVVDHDHACCPKPETSCGSCVRGLLCSRCNVALGIWQDNPRLVLAAAAYLMR